jgi:gamma-polyglutamate synthase
MTQFIPERGTLFTTEEEMYPILREGAERVGTDIRPVGWKEAGLIHQSLLARFPYAEHPFNIALVTAMAAELDLEADYAVKEMADRVVADLGVLKIYPRSQIDGRTLEFVMGMSANERFGAMGNWSRMGFADHDIAKDPEIFISTVVNNRADRVPRSRVFARILVEDVAADRHVLIGSNIDGLLGFIAESWAEYAGKLSLFGQEQGPAETFAALAARQRVPLVPEALAGRLAAMLAPQGERISAEVAQAAAREGRLGQALAKIDHGEAIAAHYDEQAMRLAEYQALAARVAAGGDQAAIDGDMREFLRKCFFAKLVPVREFYTPGEQIIRLIAAQTPPGLINRIMGMQNIKGTGLDYVYRWQAWETCHKACGQALDADPGIARRGLDLLGAFQEYGALSERHVRATVAELKQAAGGATGAGDIQLDAILARLETQMAGLDADAQDAAGGAAGSSGGKLGEWVEALLDSTDAVRRRRAADRLYRELIAEQISSQRAAFELKKLTARQKGGWLGPSIASLGDALRALVPWRHGKQTRSIG